MKVWFEEGGRRLTEVVPVNNIWAKARLKLKTCMTYSYCICLIYVVIKIQI